MIPQAALWTLCLFLGLLCLRFYRLIARENVMQRRVVAIAGGLGAGLIYIFGTMILDAWRSLQVTGAAL